MLWSGKESILFTYLLTYGAQPFLRSRQFFAATQELPSILWNLKVHKILSTGHYPEPYQSNAHHPILFLYDPI
jgi:hypothetical protein